MYNQASLLIYVILSLLCIVIADSDDHLVYKLVDSNWEDSISGIWMVKFYAPWCAHCKAYAPIFRETARITAEAHPYVNFGEINCDSNTISCSEYRVTGYPTTLLLFNGKLIAKYRESRDSATKIRSWILKQLNTEHLRKSQDLEENEIEAIIEIVQNWDNKPMKRKRPKHRHKKNKNSDGLLSFEWEFNGINDLYYRILGDTHPTVPFVIYLIGTLSGIMLGVGMVFCAAN